MKVLYLGTDPSRFPKKENFIHFPLIQIKPLAVPQEVLNEVPHFTHVIVTSPNTAHLLHPYFAHKNVFAVGKGTAAVLRGYGVAVVAVAAKESQEGMIELLEGIDLKGAYLFYPRSSQARPKLLEYLERRELKVCVCDAYETIVVRPKESVDFGEVGEIIFTSPSTVRAFVELYGQVPKGVKCTCIGPVTEEVLRGVLL